MKTKQPTPGPTPLDLMRIALGLMAVMSCMRDMTYLVQDLFPAHQPPPVVRQR